MNIKIKITAIVMAVTMTTQVMADESPEQVCSGISDIAEVIMTHRQNGGSMGKIYSDMPNSLGEAMVRDAYNQPLRYSDEFKGREISQFRDQAFSLCIESLSNDRVSEQ